MAAGDYFTNVGKAAAAKRFDVSDTNTYNRIGWGTGAGAGVITATALTTESAETRATATLSNVTTTLTNDTFQAVGTMTATGARTITEAGLFSAASAGTMLMVSEFTGVVLATNDSIEFTFKLKIA